MYNYNKYIIFFLYSKKPEQSKKNINTFYQAKIIASQIHQKIPGSFYCGCKIIWKNKKGIPDLSSCGYKIRKNKNRAMRIEWEHIVPAWQFGHMKQCWKKGGRKGCDHDKKYQKIESDLHNLQPAIGEINGDRSNFMYSQWNDISYQYGKCKIKIDFKNKRIEPPDRSKGIIARTYFYMHKKYSISLSKNQKKLFIMWDHKFPVTKWECLREKEIFKIQGNHNYYVYHQCYNIKK
ncbi:endonuclease [Buchnera aphidicola]|uniref:endonuclease n=1 Tax=Buchnera aphidicola TaxID=9 RepID=UPI003BEEF8F1